MQVVKRTRSGIAYLTAILKQKERVVTSAVFWRIPHRSGAEDDIRLKVGRYARRPGSWDTLECGNPKSELTLDYDEFQQLIYFIGQNYEPFKRRVTKYIPLDDRMDARNVEHLRAIFADPDKQKVLDFLAMHSIVPHDVLRGLEHRRRERAVEYFEEMLNSDLKEGRWQAWFTENSWVLGSEFVRVLEEREIDTRNIADYLMQAYDGFLDIIEIKRPEGGLRFWATSKDHGNYVPSIDLVKAITQATRYIHEVEREADSVKFQDRIGGVKAIKPRCILVFGRSQGWNREQREAYRILNASYHNITILTYDHVLSRAKRMLGVEEEVERNRFDLEDDEIPF